MKTKNIPYLIKLMDDESDFVRGTTLRELRAFGGALKSELEKLPEGLTEDEIASIIRLVEASGHAQTNTQFQIGQLVKHRRYGYRGVVVAYDPSCQADDDWYNANRTQPDRNQPWYHVLVSESDQITYPAESSLTVDDSGDEISNPLISHFFTSFDQGRYIRNERSWTS